MLFGYPVEATVENWLHDALMEMVRSVHLSVDAEIDPPAWPEIIPTAARPRLRSRRGIRSRLNLYTVALKTISSAGRLRVLDALEKQNKISDLCNCAEDCEKVSQLPVAIRAPVLDLFTFAFELLTPLGVRDRQYQIVFDALSDHVCPFCGCEYFDAPGAPREDLDHYLPRVLYPFAAANLNNLVPMGMRCNERYKKAQDLLLRANGTRRPVFNPFSAGKIEINLDGSVPFAGTSPQLPEWDVQFVPCPPECEAWDDVFSVRKRLKRDVLDQSFLRWLRMFADWFRTRIGDPNPDENVLLDAIKQYAEDARLTGLCAREFLKAPVFEMLHAEVTGGNTRLGDLLLDVVGVE